MGSALLDVSAMSGWMPAAVVAACVILLYVRSPSYELSHIPTAGGPSLPLLSYIGSKRFVQHAREILQEGYEKYHGRIFKVATPDRWMVVLTDPKLMHELLQLPDDVMSFDKIVHEQFAGEYTFGKEVLDDRFHIDVIRRQLTQRLVGIFPEIYDEVEQAFNDHIPITDDWTPIRALSTSMACIARISNRAFVGLPACRNAEFLGICLAFTRKLNETRKMLTWFPKAFKPFVASYMTPLPASIARAEVLLRPEIQRRKVLLQEDAEELPDDMLMWMIQHVKNDPARSGDRSFAIRMLTLNFAAIHTSSTTFTHALYTLAANPEYIKPLREEIEAVLEDEGGVTKVAMTNMYKLDSFLRECTRMNTFSGISMQRLSQKPHTFSDGTHIPAGVLVAASSWARHTDERAYADAHTFAPFRFEHPPNAGGGDDDTKAPGPRRQFTTTDLQYIPFGHGRHACPGRFFAGNELKAMFVHVLRTYDIRTVEPGVRPADVKMGQSMLPNPTARVLFRKRRD